MHLLIVFIFRPSVNNIKTFTAADKIAIADGYPRDVNGKTQIMIAVKANKNNNALCSATSSRRKRRSITLSNLEIAIPQAVLQEILSDTSM